MFFKIILIIMAMYMTFVCSVFRFCVFSFDYLKYLRVFHRFHRLIKFLLKIAFVIPIAKCIFLVSFFVNLAFFFISEISIFIFHIVIFRI